MPGIVGLVVCITAVVFVNVLHSKIQQLTTKDILPYGKTKITGVYSPSLTIGHEFRFGGELFNQVKVAMDGCIAATYQNKSGGNGITSRGTIQVYFAPVDETNQPQVWYRTTTNQSDLTWITDILHDVTKLYWSFTAAHALVVTWDSVGFRYANGDGKKVTNTFQAVIASNEAGTQTFAIFSYVKLNWFTRDPLCCYGGVTTGVKGPPAYADFQISDHAIYTLPGSHTPKVRKLAKKSNIGVPGRWVFKISEENILTGKDAATVDCRKGFTQLGDHCYYFYDEEPKPWYEAQFLCYMMGAKLAEPRTRVENLMVKGLVLHYNKLTSWIGATDLYNEGHWFYASTRTRVGYTDWTLGEPDINDRNTSNLQDCVRMWREKDLRWDDYLCAEPYPFVCQQTSYF